MSKSEVQKSSFLYQLNEYGIWRIVRSLDFTLALLLFVVLLQGYLTHSTSFSFLDATSTLGIVTITATIFAIIIASVAIILSFSGTKFAEFLRENGKFHGILFNFWLCCNTYLLVLLLAFAKYVIHIHPPYFLSSLYSAFVISGFVYAVLQTFYCVSSIMKFAHFLDYYESRNRS